ncbi:VOC family protein [Oceanibacterium hippocampi]|uniref:Glyoxalase/fosfomycin resistance/dioxygenase domain-containing protein n=1 Tax=Oceanibacterium hippocampi TaxID=745714 RepID=A0A1Y5TM00_9PROT|nr:VOC family protein [Oceanibacterium hippocampi]SLN63321.1 hypothetical protein OCH7691_02834 [Oceanibacterium hippocampi]
MLLAPYLTFYGNCRAAFEFYEMALGGKIMAMISFADMPADATAPEIANDLIMHAHMTIGEQTLMASDAPPEQAGSPTQGICLSLQVDDAAEAETLFGRLAEGGTVQMPLQETFWATRFGMVTDRFGTPWMVNCSNDWRPDQP